MSVLYIVLGLIAAYLIGSIPSAVWIGKIFYNVDVRTQGSKNAGATNTIRVLGLKPGIVVLLIDAFKGFLAVSLAQWIAPYTCLEGETSAMYQLGMGICAIVGHIFPIYVGFKGGKGVATIVGIIIALYPLWVFLSVLVIFILILSISGYVSLASITSAVLLPFIYLYVEMIGFHKFYLTLSIFAVIIAIFIPITHRKNIKRLLQGTENKFSYKKSEAYIQQELDDEDDEIF